MADIPTVVPDPDPDPDRRTKCRVFAPDGSFPDDQAFASWLGYALADGRYEIRAGCDDTSPHPSPFDGRDQARLDAIVDVYGFAADRTPRFVAWKFFWHASRRWWRDRPWRKRTVGDYA